jgi:ribosomal protein L40E
MYGYNSYSDVTSSIIGLFVVVAVLLVIFLLLRQVVLWYYKINIIVEQQERILQALERLSPPPIVEITKNESTSEGSISDKWICPKCKSENYLTATVCPNCGTKQPL